MNIVDLVGKLPVHKTLKYLDRPLSAIKFLVLHHAAGPEDQTPEQIARFHVDSRHWPGIAYSFCISTDGTVYKCWPQTTKTYCVANGNTNSLCVVLIGNRSVIPCPPAQWTAAVELFQTLREAYPGRQIFGHREVPTDPKQSTACPGSLTDMTAFRQAVDLQEA